MYPRLEPLFHLPPRPPGSKLSQSPSLSSLSQRANFHWLSILLTVVYMFPCYFLHSSHPLLPFPCVHKSVFYVCVSFKQLCFKVEEKNYIRVKKKKTLQVILMVVNPILSSSSFFLILFWSLFHQFSERQYNTKNGNTVQGNFWTWEPSKTEFEICPKLLKLQSSLGFNFLICGMEIFMSCCYCED